MVLLELLQQVGDAYLVPAFGDLAVSNDDEGGAGDGGLLAGWSETEAAAKVSHRGPPTDSYAVSFGNDVLDGDVLVGEGAAEVSMNLLECFWSYEDRVGAGKAIAFALGVEHCLDRCFASLIPDFFEPTAGQVLIRFRHGGLP